MVYTYEYDTAYHGPALPVVEIEVGAAGGNLNNRLTLKRRGGFWRGCYHDSG